MNEHLVPLGSTVPPYGRVVAIRFAEGERYYHLLNKSGGVAVMPANQIESTWRRRPLGVQHVPVTT